MMTITCTVYEKCDFIEFLEYAKRKRIEEYEKQKITRAFLEYELERINTLLKRIDGKYVSDYCLTSSKYLKKRASKYILNTDSTGSKNY